MSSLQNYFKEVTNTEGLVSPTVTETVTDAIISDDSENKLSDVLNKAKDNLENGKTKIQDWMHDNGWSIPTSTETVDEVGVTSAEDIPSAEEIQSDVMISMYKDDLQEKYGLTDIEIASFEHMETANDTSLSDGSALSSDNQICKHFPTDESTYSLTDKAAAYEKYKEDLEQFTENVEKYQNGELIDDNSVNIDGSTTYDTVERYANAADERIQAYESNKEALSDVENEDAYNAAMSSLRAQYPDVANAEGDMPQIGDIVSQFKDKIVTSESKATEFPTKIYEGPEIKGPASSKIDKCYESFGENLVNDETTDDIESPVCDTF